MNTQPANRDNAQPDTETLKARGDHGSTGTSTDEKEQAHSDSPVDGSPQGQEAATKGQLEPDPKQAEPAPAPVDEKGKARSDSPIDPPA